MHKCYTDTSGSAETGGHGGTPGDTRGHVSQHVLVPAGTRWDMRGHVSQHRGDMGGHLGTRGDTGGHRGTHGDTVGHSGTQGNMKHRLRPKENIT